MPARDILFVTLDSCRHDVYEAAATPVIDRVGRAVRAYSPSHFTYGAHAAFFVGFTPGDPARRERYINPKYGKIFRMHGGGVVGQQAAPYLALEGRSIIDGLRRLGYRAIGSGGVGWFNPETDTGRLLSADFDRFHYGGGASLRAQRAWLMKETAEARADGRPLFAFLNVAETHVPYYHEGATWDAAVNPCLPFADDNDAAESRRRQIACLEWVDAELAPLLDAYADAAIIVCADHGDCWGEDGLWEHGVHHAKTLEVPLVLRLPDPPPAFDGP